MSKETAPELGEGFRNTLTKINTNNSKHTLFQEFS